MIDDDYVYDEVIGEWVVVGGDVVVDVDVVVVVCDLVGNVLVDGDQVMLIKDLIVKGVGQMLKWGMLIKLICLIGDVQEIDCCYDGIKGFVLCVEFVCKW